MTPARFREARHALGLSARQMALALDAVRPPNPRTIRRWEAGANPIPAWVPPRIAALIADPPAPSPAPPPA